MGMTRAKEHLYLSHADYRYLWGTPRYQEPSLFLEEIPRQYIEKSRRGMSTRAPAPIIEMPPRPRPAAIRFAVEKEEEPQEEYGEDLDAGDAVFHKEFGVGVVKQAYQGSMGLSYKVHFSKDNRERTLVAKFAHLKRL